MRFLGGLLVIITLLACAILAPRAAHGGSPAIFNGNQVLLLKQNLSLNRLAFVLSGTADPSSSATSAPQGSLYLRTGASGGELYVKQDAGSSTNWRKTIYTTVGWPFGTGIIHSDSSGNLSSSLISNADVSPTAQIALTKLVTGTVNRVLVNNSSGVPSELAALTATKMLETNASGLPVASSFAPATNANTVSAGVARDGSGNFSAGTISAALTGAASLNVLKAGDTMTGPLVMPLGSSGAPSITPTGSTSTGPWFPSTAAIAWSIGGTEYGRLNATGQWILGAGPSGLSVDADTTLHVKSVNDNVGGTLVLEGTGSGGNRFWNHLARANGDYYFYNIGAGEQAWAVENAGRHLYAGPSPASYSYRFGVGGVDTTTTITDYTTISSVRPGMAIRNTNTTVGNFSSITNYNGSTVPNAAVSFVNDNHSTEGSQTGHVAIVASKSGTRTQAAAFYQDKVLLPVAPLTKKGVVTSDSTGEIASNTLTNGQMLIGSTGDAPVVATLTAGTGIAITNGAGSVSIAASGLPAPVAAVKTSGYTLVSTDDDITWEGTADGTLTLPSCAATGTKIWKVSNNSNTIATVALNAADTINLDGTASWPLIARGAWNYFKCLGGTTIYVE